MLRRHVEGVDTAIIIRVPLQLVIVPLLQAENKSKNKPRLFSSGRADGGTGKMEKNEPSRAVF